MIPNSLPVTDSAVTARRPASSPLDGHRSGIHAFIRKRGFTAEEADDLTQETLIRAYTHLSGFRGRSLSTWLCCIAKNLTVDYRRRQRYTAVPLEVLEAEPADATDPGARLNREAQREMLLAALEQLPEHHRHVLRLRFFEEYSVHRIAGALECTPTAAKLRLFRALTALRKRWETVE